MRTVQLYNLVKPNITKCFVIYPVRWEHTLFPDFTWDTVTKTVAITYNLLVMQNCITVCTRQSLCKGLYTGLLHAFSHKCLAVIRQILLNYIPIRNCRKRMTLDKINFIQKMRISHLESGSRYKGIWHRYGSESWARICKPFLGAQESILSLAGLYDNPIWRTGPPGYIGWRNGFLGIDSWAPETFTNTRSGYLFYPNQPNILKFFWQIANISCWRSNPFTVYIFEFADFAQLHNFHKKKLYAKNIELATALLTKE